VRIAKVCGHSEFRQGILYGTQILIQLLGHPTGRECAPDGKLRVLRRVVEEGRITLR